jgi:hypothetical protein
VAQQRDKYPEKVPFRLTRMLIHAMEVSVISYWWSIADAFRCAVSPGRSHAAARCRWKCCARTGSHSWPCSKRLCMTRSLRGVSRRRTSLEGG